MKSPSKAFSISNDRISGYFCSETVYNLSKKVLIDIEIKVLKKGLDYTPIQNKINELELTRDFSSVLWSASGQSYGKTKPTHLVIPFLTKKEKIRLLKKGIQGNNLHIFLCYLLFKTFFFIPQKTIQNRSQASPLKNLYSIPS